MPKINTAMSYSNLEHTLDFVLGNVVDFAEPFEFPDGYCFGLVEPRPARVLADIQSSSEAYSRTSHIAIEQYREVEPRVGSLAVLSAFTLVHFYFPFRIRPSKENGTGAVQQHLDE